MIKHNSTQNVVLCSVLCLLLTLSVSCMQTDLAGLSNLTVLKSLKLTGPAAPSCRVSAGLAAGLAPLVQLQVLTGTAACFFGIPRAVSSMLSRSISMRSESEASVPLGQTTRPSSQYHSP